MSDAIFSPTETEDFQRCAAYWAYNKRWEARGGWQPYMLLGNAVHAGLAVHYANLRPGAVVGAPLEEALTVLAQGFNPDQNDYTLEGLTVLVTKGLDKAVKTDILAGGTIIAAEQLISRTRIDLVMRRPGEGLAVVDHKVKMELTKDKLPWRLRDFDTSWQLRHEAWAVSQHFGEPVEWAYIHLVVLSPRVFTHLHPVQLGAERLAHWERSAGSWWSQLAGTDPANPPMNPGACYRYGRCTFYAACHELHGDETKFETFYQPRERS